MRKLLFPIALLIVSIIAPSCNTTDGNPPIIYIEDARNYVDTVRYSTQAAYEVNFTLEDDIKSHKLTATSSEVGVLFYNDDALSPAKTELVSISSGKFKFKPFGLGRAAFTLTIDNEQEANTTSKVTFEVVNNLEPEADLELNQTDSNAPFEVEMIATGSQDPDEGQGGGIVAYEFNIVGFYKTETVRNTISYIFPEAGTYEVRLRVKDTDGAWSKESIESIDVD